MCHHTYNKYIGTPLTVKQISRNCDFKKVYESEIYRCDDC